MEKKEIHLEYDIFAIVALALFFVGIFMGCFIGYYATVEGNVCNKFCPHYINISNK